MEIPSITPQTLEATIESYHAEISRKMARAQKAVDIIYDCIFNRYPPELNLGKAIEENPIDALTLLLLLDRAGARQISKRQIEAAIEGAKKRPSTEVKMEIRNLWEEWVALPKAEKKARYKGQHEFSLAMEDKFYDVENGKPRVAYSTIKNKWIPEWTREKSNPAGSVVTQPVRVF